MSFKFGFSKQDITPDFPTCLACSQQKDTLFKRVHDHIFVRCAVLSAHKSFVVILSYDLLFHSRELYSFVHRYLSELYDVAESDILINYTHNHNAPSVLGYNDFSASEQYEELLKAKTVSALNEAFHCLLSGTMEYGIIKGNWNINRRRSSEDGIKLAPNPGGPADKDMYVLKFLSTDNKIKGLIINYACHPVHYPDTLGLTSEYPGHLCRYIEDALPECIPLFIQGAGADTRPAETAVDDRFTPRSYEYIEEMAKSMTSAILTKLKTSLFSKTTPSFDSVNFNIEIPTEEAGSEYFKNSVNDENLSYHLRRNAKYVFNNYDLLKNSFTLHCGIIQLSETLLITHMGGEPVCQVKFAIENLLNEYDMIFAGYTDACSYIVTDEMIDEGGYEVRCFLEYRHKGKIKKGINKIILTGYKTCFEALTRGGRFEI